MLNMELGCVGGGVGAWKGDGCMESVCRIGAELVMSAQKVIEAAGAPIEWSVVDNVVDRMTPEAIDALNKHHVVLKGEFEVGAWLGGADGRERARERSVRCERRVWLLYVCRAGPRLASFAEH